MQNSSAERLKVSDLTLGNLELFKRCWEDSIQIPVYIAAFLLSSIWDVVEQANLQSQGL
jgi:hypothetical protein